MAVFRVEKTKNYTVMSNFHLKDKTLTLKAKGLLSIILSLPEEWNYTTRGLAAICREGVDCIGAALRELETAGYIERNRLRDELGKITDTEYVIYEFPQDKPEKDPNTGKPHTDSPCTGNPYMDKPDTGNPAQINIDRVITEKSNTDLSNTDSIPFPSPRTRESDSERKGTEAVNMNDFELYREIVWENLSYPIMCERHRYDREKIDEIVDLILETVCTARTTIRIAGDDYPAELVKSKFLKLHDGHLEFVLDCMKKNTTEIRNIKKYMLAVLFNAPSTLDSYYTALVAHDMAHNWGNKQ